MFAFANGEYDMVGGHSRGKSPNKALKINAFAPTGRTNSLTKPRAMPQAMCFWPFRPFPLAADLFDVQPVHRVFMSIPVKGQGKSYIRSLKDYPHSPCAPKGQDLHIA